MRLVAYLNRLKIFYELWFGRSICVHRVPAYVDYDVLPEEIRAYFARSPWLWL